MTAARLTLDALAVGRAGHPVLEEVTFAVGAGEVLALVGPSGVGKTSLLRCIVRLDEPLRGQVLIDGIDARDLDPGALRRRVGLVTQLPVMLPGSVRENLTYAMQAPAERVLATALESVGLSAPFLERAARELSGGEAARVAMARALVREPAVLLLDEPTSALDAPAAAVVESLVGDIARGGMAIVIVTHDERRAARVATHAARLIAGGLQAVGTSAEVLET